MKLYHASVYVSNFGRMGYPYSLLTEREREMYESHEHILESYHYLNDRLMGQLRTDNRRIFLDSGAFSAFMVGAKIDVGAYCDFIAKNQELIEVASVLDVIGDPDGTWRNQDEMERRGAAPLPCYHYGEPPEVLEHYAARYEYITIGGMVPIATSQLRMWLDRIWQEHLTHEDGAPKIKVHGFGLTTLDLVCRYPWYSVDSSSWQAISSNGSLMLPNGRTLAVSADAPQRKNANQHLDSMTPPVQAAIEKLIREHGCEPENMRGHYAHRRAWNMWAFNEAAERRGICTRFDVAEQVLF